MLMALDVNILKDILVWSWSKGRTTLLSTLKEQSILMVYIFTYLFRYLPMEYVKKNTQVFWLN